MLPAGGAATGRPSLRSDAGRTKNGRNGGTPRTKAKEVREFSCARAVRPTSCLPPSLFLLSRDTVCLSWRISASLSHSLTLKTDSIEWRVLHRKRIRACVAWCVCVRTTGKSVSCSRHSAIRVGSSSRKGKYYNVTRAPRFCFFTQMLPLARPFIFRFLFPPLSV